MYFVTNILFLSAAFLADSVLGDGGKHPHLDAKGIVGLRDCGTKNDLIKITSLTMGNCKEAPCDISSKSSVKISVEFVPLENISSLSTTVTTIVNGMRVVATEEDACKTLVVGKCPLIKGEIYKEEIVFDIAKDMPPAFEKVLKENGYIRAETEVVISNPDKTSSVCASYSSHAV